MGGQINSLNLTRLAAVLLLWTVEYFWIKQYSMFNCLHCLFLLGADVHLLHGSICLTLKHIPARRSGFIFISNTMWKHVFCFVKVYMFTNVIRGNLFQFLCTLPSSILYLKIYKIRKNINLNPKYSPGASLPKAGK